MALTDFEKQQIFEALDRIDDASKALTLASHDAFAEWLSRVLYLIFLKVRDVLTRIWNWIRSQF